MDETSAGHGWPPEPPPRIDAAEVLDALRANLRSRINYVIELGYRPSTLAGLAGMSDGGLRGFASPDWDPTPATMVQLDRALVAYLPGWIRDARANPPEDKLKAG